MRVAAVALILWTAPLLAGGAQEASPADIHTRTGDRRIARHEAFDAGQGARTGSQVAQFIEPSRKASAARSSIRP